jgi:hypothetical protein
MTPLDNQPSWHSHSNHDLTSMPFTAGNKESLSERDPRLRMQFTDYLIRPVQQISTSTCPTYPQPRADGTYWNGCSRHGCKKGDGGCCGPRQQHKLFAPSATANFSHWRVPFCISHSPYLHPYAQALHISWFSRCGTSACAQGKVPCRIPLRRRFPCIGQCNLRPVVCIGRQIHAEAQSEREKTVFIYLLDENQS